MCGFVGYIKGKVEDIPHQDIIHRMTDTLQHRGPDSDGFFEDEKVMYGFRRLKIIDLSAYGDQPLYNEVGDHVLMFNGEIYNYKSLREELKEMGYKFTSQTDSEVIIHGYDAWGPAVCERLRGMFAFVIWDKNRKELFMARDPFGIKPLYYSSSPKDGTFFFGSEIKAFLPHPSFEKELNTSALKPYLSFQYSATPETFFKGVFKLTPGHWMLVKDGKISQKKRYWDFHYVRDESNLSFDEAIQEIDDALRDSVSVHQISDVKVGAFLSGGIDSSYVTSLFSPEDTFSVGFDSPNGNFDETSLGQKLSELKGFTHHKKMISPEEFFSVLPTIQYHMDEPQSNLSAVPLYYLAQLASQYVTVVLSGEGADELFGGYDAYVDTPHLSTYKKLPYFLRRLLYHASKSLPYNRLTDLFKRGGATPEESFIGEALVFTPKEAEELLTKPFKNGIDPHELTDPIYEKVKDADDLTKKQVLDILLWMPGDILLKADRMSMAHSLELRVPFLDKEVMKVAEKLPPRYRVNGQKSKYALRTAALKELPEEWAKRPKKGFPVPLRYWLRDEKYAQPIREAFLSEEAKEFFDQAKILKLLEDHEAKRANNQRKIYTIYSFLLWYREFFINR